MRSDDLVKVSRRLQHLQRHLSVSQPLSSSISSEHCHYMDISKTNWKDMIAQNDSVLSENMKELSLDEWKSLKTKEVGLSPWITVDQRRVDAFSVVTGDPQWIHTSEAADMGSPFGGPIAHGYLVLSLTSLLTQPSLPMLTGTKMGVNYGLNKVRFVSPVKVGARIRARIKLVDVETVKGGVQNTLGVTIEVEGSDKPAIVFEWITRLYL